mmetsp:Transcript_93306/g.185176  ORF Transcript_93306/g.185176 Transcript_93306/m.185176 type:complete len:288 (-) Transcript_93306:249-1112(-)
MTLWGTVTALQTLPSLGSQPIELVIDMDDESKAGPSDLSEGIRSLYQKCQFYDVMLVVGGKRFPAHQSVLASLSGAMSERLRQALEKPAAGTGEAASPERPASSTPQALSPASATSPRKATSPAASPGAENRIGYPEVHLNEITNTEAVTVLIDYVYGLGAEYHVSSDEVNRDVLRLAQVLELPRLQELASTRLAKGLTSDNAVERMATCEEFGLDGLCDLIAEQVTKSGEALTRISSGSEVTKHPKILQNLLVRAANLYSPAGEPCKKRGSSSPWPAAKKARTPER